MALTRPIQLLWFAAAAVFVITLFHSMSGDLGSWTPSINTPTSAKGKHGGRLPLQEHVDLAERIWAKTVRQRHEMRKDWTDPYNMPFFPAQNDYDLFQYSIWDFVPASYSCPYEVERIGALGDGGKWVCGMSLYEAMPADKPCVIYSFGINQESSFENEMLDRTHCEVWGYDYTVADFAKQLNDSHRDRAHFKQVGIGEDTDASKTPPFYSIQDLMIMNGHDYIDILKIDIEFAEFGSLTSLSKAFTKAEGKTFPIGQILIEIHLFGTSGITSGQFLAWWEALEDRGIRATWTEPNLLAVTLNHEDKNPRLAEYTLINSKDPRSVLFEPLLQK